MQRRSLATMAVVFVSLLLYVLLVEVGREEEREAREAREEQLLPTDEESVHRLRIERSAGVVTIERRGEPLTGEWFITEPFESFADPGAARALARAAATLEEQRALEHVSADVSQYGLEDPELVVTIEADGLAGPVTLRFGAESGSGQARYVRIDGEEVIRLVSAHQYRSLDKGVDDLRDRRLLRFSPGAATQIEIASAGETQVLQRDGGVWWVAGEPRYRAARLDIDDLLANLTTSRVIRFVDADNPDLGLADSPRWISVTFDDGSAVKVVFGTGGPTGIMAQVEGSSEAAEVSPTITDPLSWPPERWRTTEVADFNPWQVTEFRMTYGAVEFEWLANEDDDWTLRQGQEPPRPVESTRARDVLTRIDKLEGTAYLDVGSDPGPEIGSFEVVSEGSPLVRFTLHRSGDSWIAAAAGDPAPLAVDETLGLFLEEFLADPFGQDG